MELMQLESLVTQYEQAQPDVIRKIEPQLRQQRKILTETFLKASDAEAENLYKGTYGKAFLVLRRIGLQNLPRTSDENQVVNNIFQTWHTLKAPSGGVLLGIMLMCPPYQLPVPRVFSQILPWLRTAYAEYLLTSPELFHQSGDAERYADFFAFVTELFRNSLLSDESYPEASEIADIFLKQANFMQTYFNDKNLCKAFRHRAEILETLALSRKMPLSHSFPMNRTEHKLKVGILASSLNSQPESLLLLSYLDRLPKEYCAVNVYALNRTGHSLEEYCKTHADQLIFLPEGNDDAQKARIIRQDGLDIMLIGGNITADVNSCTRLAMFRLADTQVIVENSPVSTGFTHSDYYLSSEFADPEPSAQEYYTEQLYRASGTLGYYAYNLDAAGRASAMTRNGLNLPHDATVYCSCAKLFKVLPEVSQAWATILSKVPNSYLVLMPFHPNTSSPYPIRAFINRINTQMSEAGVDFSRIRFLKAMPTRTDIYGMMSVCDIYLDSFPYTGACSLTDPLHVGLPVVTTSGKTLRNNIAAAILKTVGIEEMIAKTPEEYIEKAVFLALNQAHREKLRNNIRQLLSRYNPITDTASCGVKLLSAFTEMKNNRCREEIRLLIQEPSVLKEKIQKLSAKLFEQKNLYFQSLVGNEIIRLLILPYFQSYEENSKRHVIDIGACSGGSAKLFLEAGWGADMFEPDLSCEAGLNQIVGAYPGKARLFKQVVSHEAENMLIFYQAQPGFSSLEPSPYSKLQQVLFVRSVHLRDAIREHSIPPADMLHIDAEGSDLQVFAGYDIQTILPKCVMLHFDSKFASQSPDKLDAAVSGIKQVGYEALIFSCGDAKASSEPALNREYRLTGLEFDAVPKQPNVKGSMIFFRKDDSLFLAMILRLLESFLPMRER